MDGQVYGPFDDATLLNYMREGRVTPQSFVSQNAGGDFRQVATLPALMQWVETSNPDGKPTSRTCLVMADIRSGRAMAFLQTLQTLGDVHRIGDTVWLLRTHASPRSTTDVLSPPLGPEDRLIVVDATDSERASFNLGHSVDERIEALFAR